MQIGTIVKSKAGHDKESFLLVVGLEKDRALVADGKQRRLSSPKPKNPKHLAATNTVVSLPETDKQLRKLLNQFSAQED